MKDRQLLQRFVRDNSQEAFALLTARYLNLVYSVCRREMADADAAEDVTQAVFLILARKAPSLGRSVVLSGWLFQTARFAAKNARLQAQRRAAYEQKAAEAVMEQQTQTGDTRWAEETQWAKIEPLLNRSLSALREGDRQSILLRFFQGLSFAEVGESLGVSEEAARKRVTRSLDKMRQFFTKNGVIVPVVALATLLTTRATKAAPPTCQASISHLTSSALTGHTTAALTGSQAYQLSQGTWNAMKTAQIKIAVGITAAVMVGTATTYSIVRGQVPAHQTAQAQATQNATSRVQSAKKKMLVDNTLSQYRTVTLIGKARYEDGRPAAGIPIRAKLQDASLIKVSATEKSGPASERLNQLMMNETKTRTDGTYTLAVGSNLNYNIMHLPYHTAGGSYDDGWVAAAVVGITGQKNHTVFVPDLVLTRGAFITGTVTDKATGKAVVNVSVGGQGSEGPASSGPIVYTHTDSAGRYRLRVMPGACMVYIADGQYNGLSDDQAELKGLEKHAVTSAGQPAQVDFQVTPKQ